MSRSPLGLMELQETLDLGLISDQKPNVSVSWAKVSFTSLALWQVLSVINQLLIICKGILPQYLFFCFLADAYSQKSHTTTVLWPFFRDHPGEPVPEENFWTMMQGKTNRGRHTDRPAGRHSIRTKQCSPPLHHPPRFLQAGCPSCRPTNSVKALKATSAFGLVRRH